MATLSCAMVGPMDGINLLNKANVHAKPLPPLIRVTQYPTLNVRMRADSGDANVSL